MSLAKRLGSVAGGAMLATACARGIDDPLDLEPAGGAAGEGGSPAGGVAGNAVGGSPGASGGAGPSTGGGGSGPTSVGATGGSSGSAGGSGGSAGVAGSAAGGMGGGAGMGADASAGGGNGGSAGQGGRDASVVDAFDASAPKDAPPEAPCPGAGTALSFDLTKSQYVVIPPAAMPTGAMPRTIEMWVLNKSPIANWAANHSLWEHGGGGSLATFAMDFDNVVGPRHMELYVNPASNSLFFDTGTNQDTWFHVAGSFDGTKTHAFVNGVEIGTGLTITGTLATPTAKSFYVGSAALHNYFTGSIDEVRVWNVARTASQIAQDMNFRLVGNEPGLVGYYRFDEGSGTTARDATSRGNNGALTNGPTYAPSGVTLGCR